MLFGYLLTTPNQKNKKISFSKKQPSFSAISNKKLINFLKNEHNDLEKTVIKIYPKVKKIIDYIESQKGCYFSRISGSGSACIGIFSEIALGRRTYHLYTRLGYNRHIITENYFEKSTPFNQRCDTRGPYP